MGPVTLVQRRIAHWWGQYADHCSVVCNQIISAILRAKTLGGPGPQQRHSVPSEGRNFVGRFLCSIVRLVSRRLGDDRHA